MERTIETDVVVVGLGPAGASAAAAAARAGARTVAVDRRQGADVPVQCAELVPGLTGQDTDLLRPAIVQSIAAMRTFVESEPPDLRAPFPGYMIDRAEFDRQQREAARDAGARCQAGVVVRALRPDGVVITRAGERIAARIIIGADGPLSIVGRAVGRTNRELVYARQVTVPLCGAHDATDVFLSARVRGGYGWLFPKGTRAHVGVGVMATHKAALKTLLGELLARLHGEGRIGTAVSAQTGGVIPVGGMLGPCAALAGRPVLLAGDAAGLTNPVTGAGIHAALVTGRLAGEAAAAWLAGDAGAPGDYATEVEELFGASLTRALVRRRTVCACFDAGGTPRASDLRDGWIAFPGYWRRTASGINEIMEAVA